MLLFIHLLFLVLPYDITKCCKCVAHTYNIYFNVLDFRTTNMCLTSNKIEAIGFTKFNIFYRENVFNSAGYCFLA